MHYRKRRSECAVRRVQSMTFFHREHWRVSLLVGLARTIHIYVYTVYIRYFKQ